MATSHAGQQEGHGGIDGPCSNGASMVVMQVVMLVMAMVAVAAVGMPGMVAEEWVMG